MLDTLKELSVAREAAVQTRDNADQLVRHLDRLLNETPSDLGSMLDSLKERVLHELASNSFSAELLPEVEARAIREEPPVKDVTHTQHGELDCEFCDRAGFKNESGLMIHLGRVHPREFAKHKKSRVKTAA